jgi:hypothetical protein
VSMTAVVIALFCFAEPLAAQEVLSLEGLLSKLEEQQNPLQEATALQQKALTTQVGAPLAPNPWSLSYSAEEVRINERSGVQSLNVFKTFQLPKVEKAYRNYYEVQRAAIGIPAALAVIEIKKMATSDYIEAAYYKSLLTLEGERQEQYSRWLAIVQRKAELGEESGLAAQQIKLQQEEHRILQNKLQSQQAVHVTQMNQWLGDTNYTTLSLDSLEAVLNPSSELHPMLQQYQQSAKLLEAQNEVTTANNRAQPFAGLSVQSIDNDVLFLGYQIGINLPFAKSYLQKQKEAADFQRLALNEQQEWHSRRMNIHQQRLENVSTLLQNNLSQQRSLLQSIKALLPTQQKSWQFGESTYAELVLAYEQYFTVKKQILETQREYWLTENERVHFLD